MTIWVDTNEKQRAITNILDTFKAAGVDTIPHSLPYGDYMSLDNAKLVIDRKQNLAELCINVSDIPKKDKNGQLRHCKNGKVMTGLERFRSELSGAQSHGIKLIILCEHGKNITCLNDVIRWVNPRLKESPLAMSGERLYKVLSAMSGKYNVDFVFCTKAQTGTKIIELLGGDTH